jgi:sulfite reductase (NADPH) hemoprotein beta-component
LRRGLLTQEVAGPVQGLAGQVSLGGADGSSAGSERVAIGRIIGPSFKADQMPDVVQRLVDTFVSLREDGERFIDTVVRVGHVPFKERVYAEVAPAHKRREAVSV